MYYESITPSKIIDGVAFVCVDARGTKFKVRTGEFYYASSFPSDVHTVLWIASKHFHNQCFTLQTANNICKKMMQKVHLIICESVFKCLHHNYKNKFDIYCAPEEFALFATIYIKNCGGCDALKNLKCVSDISTFYDPPPAEVPTPVPCTSVPCTSVPCVPVPCTSEHCPPTIDIWGNAVLPYALLASSMIIFLSLILNQKRQAFYMGAV